MSILILSSSSPSKRDGCTNSPNRMHRTYHTNKHAVSTCTYRFRLCELMWKSHEFSVKMYRNSVMMVLGALINAGHGAVICAAPAPHLSLPWCTLTSHIKTNIQYIYCANAVHVTIFIFPFYKECTYQKLWTLTPEQFCGDLNQLGEEVNVCCS